MKFICVAIVGLVAARLSLAASVNNPFPYYFSGTACRATGSLGSIPIEGTHT